MYKEGLSGLHRDNYLWHQTIVKLFLLFELIYQSYCYYAHTWVIYFEFTEFSFIRSFIVVFPKPGGPPYEECTAHLLYYWYFFFIKLCDLHFWLFILCKFIYLHLHRETNTTNINWINIYYFSYNNSHWLRWLKDCN